MSLDKTLKAIGLRKKTPADKVREAGANLNARFAKLRGATPESRARAAGARYGLAAGGALAALAILVLTQTRPGPGAVGGAVAGAWAFVCADRLDALDRAEAKKSA